MINDHLALSAPGQNLLKSIEVLRLKPYDDKTGKPITEWCPDATIGYGYLIPAKEWPALAAGIDKTKAQALLLKCARPIEDAIRKAIIVPLQQQQFDALVLLAYNIGIPRLRKSSAVKLINDPQAVTPYDTLEAAWKAWNIDQGKESGGLVNRRKCEWNLWQYGIYERW